MTARALAIPLAAAVLGGGVTAAILLETGAVGDGRTTTIVEQSPLTSAAPASESRSNGLTARDIYKQGRARRGVRPRALGAADPVAVRGLPAPAGERLHRLGLRARRQGPHPHQRARGGLLHRRAGVVLRPPHGDGARDRQGPRHRPRGAGREPEGQDAPPARAGRLLRRPRRRPDRGDRQPVRARAHADHRRRVGAPAAHHGPERVRDRRTSSRPTPRSTPATRAARCSTPPAA